MTNKFIIDSIDKKLMQILYRNARRSSHELAEQLGISPSTVRFRLNRLINKGLINIVGIPNLDYADTFDVVMGINIAHDKLQSALNKLTTVPKVLWAMAVTGRYDLFIRLRLTNKDELYSFIDEELSTIDGIRNSETLVCLQFLRGTEVKIMD